MKTQVMWTVSLSNGETLYEGKNEYQIVAGEPSPWQRLNKYIDKNNLKITSISLYIDGRRFNLPSSGKNPKFKVFSDAEKPVAYNFFRKMGQDVLGENRTTETFSIIEAIYKNKRLQVWVNNETLNSWSVII